MKRLVIVAARPGDKEYESLWKDHDKTCGVLKGSFCWANCPNRRKKKRL